MTKQQAARRASVDGCQEIVLTMPLPCYGVESTRLNPGMDTDPPLHTPYEEFDYGTNGDDGDDNNGEHDNEMFYAQLDQFPITMAPLFPGIDNSASPAVFNAWMERIKAKERHAVMVLQHDVEHRCTVELLKILEDAQCPDYMLQKVLMWAYNSKLSGFDFNPKATSRKANIRWMYHALRHSQQNLPQVISIVLEDHDKPQGIACFDFAPALLSLLQDENLMAPENLVLNHEDPTSMYLPRDNKIGEAHTGKRYRELYHQLITRQNQLLVPIILYLDGTAIDGKGHVEVCPVSFTTSLFTEKLRRDSASWRVLGYVPDLNRGRSSAMNSQANGAQSKGRTTRNFHAVMDVILHGMSKAQAGDDSRLKNVPLKLGGQWVVVDIVCPLLFVINDGKQGDQLCCRTNSHHRSTPRHHRSCDCVFEDLDNPDVECSFLCTDFINDACREGSDEFLQELSIYRVDNAFNRIQMGQNPHGIFMCAVIDIMHTVQHGVIMYVLDSFKKCLSNETLAMLDRMALLFDVSCLQTIREEFPRTDFSRGITNLTLLECSEQSGALFLFAALIMQAEGWHAISRYIPDLPEVLATMECLLCFEAWLDADSYWDAIGDDVRAVASAETAINRLMSLILKYLPRNAGNGWKVSKFHELKHIVRFISTFGAPRGYNASRPEEHHKAHAKRPARRSQKDIRTIDQQCARRIADTCVINTMHALLTGVNDGKSIPNTSSPSTATKEVGRGTRYHIRSFRDPNQEYRLVREVIFMTQTRAPINLEQNLAFFILQTYSETDLDENGEGTVECSTEYMKYEVDSKEKCISIRAHPNFRGKGFPWYDWALIRFEDDDGNLDDFPCRIMSCIRRQGHTAEESTFDLVVQSCSKPTGRESILFTEWTFNKEFHVVASTALVSLCYVLVDGWELTDTVFVVKDKGKWASLFYNSVW